MMMELDLYRCDHGLLPQDYCWICDDWREGSGCIYHCERGYLPLDGALDSIEYADRQGTLLLFPVTEETACPCSAAWSENSDLDCRSEDVAGCVPDMEEVTKLSGGCMIKVRLGQIWKSKDRRDGERSVMVRTLAVSGSEVADDD